jgi:antitoxin component HigA of HigAB toxin-antitoxin module
MIEEIEGEAALYEEDNFCARAEALEALEFSVLGPIEALPHGERAALRRRAEDAKRRLEAVDARLFARLRARIRSGQCIRAEFRRTIVAYAWPSSRAAEGDHGGYDRLDAFLCELLFCGPAPEEAMVLGPEMVAYQPTPARVVLELVDQAGLGARDLFYDLGSGLGHVAMLANLLSGARAKGVELEAAFCDYARRCASELDLSQVEFVHVDARQVDYRDGTVFFLYTPFMGGLLQEVLAKLRADSQGREIRVCTYGPCTPCVSRQGWLERIGRRGDPLYSLATFRSA